MKPMSATSINTLLENWHNRSEREKFSHEYTVRLTAHEQAKIAALAEMFPGMDEAQIVRDRIASALTELEAGMPYVAGNRVISEDEQGDPIYEDAGLTPRFLELTRKHLQDIEERKD
jgi:hypothetical protein